MKVIQDKFGAEGNCTAACYATLLGCAISDIPNLCVPNQRQAERDMLASRGLGMVRYYPELGAKLDAVGFAFDTGGLYMLGGMGPRGNHHRVVAHEGKLWHDPHPDGGGLVDVREVLFIVQGAPS